MRILVISSVSLPDYYLQLRSQYCIAKLFIHASSLPVFAPLLRLSPPPSERDYMFNLDDTEGVCDFFDVPILSSLSTDLQ